MQRFISWNVASVRSRLTALGQLLKTEQPDFVLLQEIKATDDNFPFLDIQAMGYRAYISGQKAYNGVAILSKQNLSDLVYELPDGPKSDPMQARFIQGKLPDGTILISVYVPNGSAPINDPTDTSRLEYKIQWMDALTQHITRLLNQGERVILGGDFNVIERDTDVYNPKSFQDSSLMVLPVRQAFERLNQTGLKNMIRSTYPEDHTYTFWDFQMGAWPRNLGILLDFFFVSPNLVNRMERTMIYRDVRGWVKTSDHAPIGLILND